MLLFGGVHTFIIVDTLTDDETFFRYEQSKIVSHTKSDVFFITYIGITARVCKQLCVDLHATTCCSLQYNRHELVCKISNYEILPSIVENHPSVLVEPHKDTVAFQRGSCRGNSVFCVIWWNNIPFWGCFFPLNKKPWICRAVANTHKRSWHCQLIVATRLHAIHEWP